MKYHKRRKKNFFSFIMDKEKYKELEIKKEGKIGEL